MRHCDVAVIGAGMAGLTAAVFAARYGLEAVVVDQAGVGGQITTAEVVENVPGFPDGTSGVELGPLLHAQAEAAGAELLLDTVESVEKDDSGALVVHGFDNDLRARALIIAAGSSHKNLDVPGEAGLIGRGVSHCASCDGALFAGRRLAVVGGGDSAFDEAVVLSRSAEQVSIFHRGASASAQDAIADRVRQAGISVEFNAAIVEVRGEGAVSSVIVRDTMTGAEREHTADGLFVYVGQRPNTAFLAELVELDSGGHITTDILMRTSQQGVFAAGDIRAHSVAQLAAAAGDGATAAITAAQYLFERA